ncbi:MAG: hypothetical protein QOC82_3143 [Frankiaceae bacterium]|jgi:hypothetical protein|nr:hypothetical protein [Frankiaceae bacterium]
MREAAFAVALLGMAALAVPAEASTAHAKCVGAAVTDPAGDVQVASGVHVPESHVDLRTVALTPTAKAFLVTFTDTKLDSNRKGVWRLTFTSRHTSLYVTAGLGIWSNAGTASTVSGFHAGVVNGAAHSVSGVFDYARNTITVTASYDAFGSAVPRGRTVVTDVAIESSETFAHAGTTGTPSQSVEFMDTAGAPELTLTRC